MTTLRESLESAVKTAEAVDEPSHDNDTPIIPEGDTSGASDTPAATPAPAPGPEDDDTATAPAPAVPPTGGQTPAPTPPAPEPDDPAPGSWTPAAREEWKQLPKTIKEEVRRREAATSRALTESTEARKFQREFQDVVQPFMGFIAAENSTPIAAVKNLMQTAAILRVGTPQQKVAAAAQIIQQFGIDLMMLDSVLAGQSPQVSQSAALQQMVSHELAPIRQFMTQQQQFLAQQDQALGEKANAELEKFAAEHEFYNDVRETMADLIEAASRRGGALSLTAAYDRAIMLHEPVRQVIEARKQRQAAQNSQRQADTARRNATSVSGSEEASAVGAPASGDSLRDAINAAILKTSSR